MLCILNPLIHIICCLEILLYNNIEVRGVSNVKVDEKIILLESSNLDLDTITLATYPNVVRFPKKVSLPKHGILVIDKNLPTLTCHS